MSFAGEDFKVVLRRKGAPRTVPILDVNVTSVLGRAVVVAGLVSRY